MRVYIVKYNNGEAYEDFNEWISDVAYSSTEKCEECLLSQGFIKEKSLFMGIQYWTKDMSKKYWEQTYYAQIIELEVQE